jgi:hypothetical protein
MYKKKNALRALAFDSSNYVTVCQACHLLEAGYLTAFRYLKRRKKVYDTPQSWPVSLSHQELKELTDIGLRVSLVQFLVSESNGGGSGYDKGREYGDAAGWNAEKLGAPAGITVWCDAEGWENRGRDEILSYLNGWAEVCAEYGYVPGLYVGAGLGKVGDMVTGEDLYQLPKYKAYWRAASIVPQVPTRGFTVVQGVQLDVFGLTIDQDMIALDHKAKSENSIFKVIGK